MGFTKNSQCSGHFQTKTIVCNATGFAFIREQPVCVHLECESDRGLFPGIQGFNLRTWDWNG